MKAIKIYSVGMIIVLAAFMVGVSLGRVIAAENLEAKLTTFMQAMDIVKNEYVDKKVDDGKLVYGAIRGMIDSLDDPYSRFMEPSSFKEMRIRMGGSYGGIGIYIGIKDKQIIVLAPIEDTPAMKAGLKPKDKIMAINGKNTKDMSLEEAVSLIRGPDHTKVRLGILREKMKEPQEFAIIRSKIVIRSIKTKMYDNNQVGYIRLITFENRKAAEEMETAMREVKAKGARGLLLDLRNNGGGLLQNAVEIASMFLKLDVPIVYTVDREGKKEVLTSLGQVLWDKPMVILINEGSASASEIVAGALQDNGTATLVGMHTFGKASVQNIRQLDDGSAILVTVAKYLTPKGRDISKKGIAPDIKIEIPSLNGKSASEEAEELLSLTPEELEKKDVQLQKALQIIEERIK